MRKAALALLVVSLIAAVTASGCGDDAPLTQAEEDAIFAREHPGSADAGSPPLEFEASPSGLLAYTTDEVNPKEGNVTIELTNPQAIPHNVVIEGEGGWSVETPRVQNGFAAVTVTLNNEEEIIFYCAVPGHREAGMEGIVNVAERN